MAVRKLDKTEWKEYCEKVSKMIASNEAKVEILSEKIGSQVQAKWAPIFGIVYDPKSDIVEVILKDLDHLIHYPVEIYVDDSPTSLASLEVVDREGVRNVLLLRKPLKAKAEASVRSDETGRRP